LSSFFLSEMEAPSPSNKSTPSKGEKVNPEVKAIAALMKTMAKAPQTTVEDTVSQLSVSTRAELLAKLSFYEKSAEKKANKKKSRVKAERDFEVWYYKIRDDMRANMAAAAARGGNVDFAVSVNASMSLHELMEKTKFSLEELGKYVRNGIEAAKGAQNLAISNFIVAARRVGEAISFYEQHKTKFAEKNIPSQDAFLNSLSISFTPEYVDKLQLIYIISVHYPNISYVTACGIEDFARFGNRFVDWLMGDIEEARVWRQGQQKEMERRWTVQYHHLEDEKPRPPIVINFQTQKQTEDDWKARKEVDTKIVLEKVAKEEAEKKLLVDNSVEMKQKMRNIGGNNNNAK
jgi:hypothetical protein